LRYNLFLKLSVVCLKNKLTEEINENAEKIGIDKANVKKSIKNYSKPAIGKLEEI